MSTRIKGTNLKFTLGTTSQVEYMADCISVVLENEEAASNAVTFADAAAGGSWQWFFTVEAIQSTDTASFWRKMWDAQAAGTTLNYTFNPHGAATPTTAKPNFTGTIKLKQPPAIGGTASTTDDYTFTVRLDCQETPTLVTA